MTLPFSKRRAASSLALLAILSIVALACIVLYLAWFSSPTHDRGTGQIQMFCAAGMRYPLEQIVEDYEQEYGIQVNVQYGGSNTLLSQLEVSQTGDLFLAADDSYIQLVRGKGLAREVIPLATMRPVIAVRADNPHGISQLDDLLQPGLRLACGNPEAAAIGRKTKRLLEISRHWDAINKHINELGVFKPTVNEVANDVKLGSVDAGIVWDSTAAQYPELQAIRVPELEQGVAHVQVAVLEASRNPTAAIRFARYIGARDRGLQAFESHHFPVVVGDCWEEVPELTFFAGSVNRRALAPIVKAFESREGVSIYTIYNGCGILTGQMRLLAKNQDRGFPDTYMACDVYYLETVKDWFQDAVNVSDTDIVIALQKGNPKGIQSLRDLLKPGVRVAIGQPEQCTIGVLTRRMLEHEGIYDELLQENVVTQTETSALLVPAVTTKSVDAVLAYRTDTLAERDKLDVVTIDSDLSKAIQPFSIAKSSDHKYLGRRLYETIANSRDSFESAGFHWRLNSTESADDASFEESPDRS